MCKGVSTDLFYEEGMTLFIIGAVKGKSLTFCCYTFYSKYIYVRAFVRSRRSWEELKHVLKKLNCPLLSVLQQFEIFG